MNPPSLSGRLLLTHWHDFNPLVLQRTNQNNSHLQIIQVFFSSKLFFSFLFLPFWAQSHAYCCVSTAHPFTAEATVIRCCPTVECRIYSDHNVNTPREREIIKLEMHKLEYLNEWREEWEMKKKISPDSLPSCRRKTVDNICSSLQQLYSPIWGSSLDTVRRRPFSVGLHSSMSKS